MAKKQSEANEEFELRERELTETIELLREKLDEFGVVVNEDGEIEEEDEDESL